MRDYSNLQSRQNIINKWSQLFPNSLPLTICVTTLNRLEYLKKCVWSIIASTSVPYQLVVSDDGSLDGTVAWLQIMHSRKLLEPLFNCGNGSAANSNKALLHFPVKAEWKVLIQDDIWVHRYWDLAAMYQILNNKEIGVLSFYRFTRLGDKDNYPQINSELIKGSKTGMSANFIYMDTFRRAKCFKLGGDRKMGYFATPFCKRMSELQDVSRNKVYFTNPHYASMMDMAASKLNEKIYAEETGYNEYRRKEKLMI